MSAVVYSFLLFPCILKLLKVHPPANWVYNHDSTDKWTELQGFVCDISSYVFALCDKLARRLDIGSEKLADAESFGQMSVLRLKFWQKQINDGLKLIIKVEKIDFEEKEIFISENNNFGGTYS